MSSRPMTIGQALHRLHAALPRPVNFTLGRSEWTHAQRRDEAGIEAGLREESEWSVVIQWPDARVGTDRYIEATRGEDLADIVEQALAKFFRWAEGDAISTGTKPPKLTAPGSADAADATREQKDAS